MKANKFMAAAFAALTIIGLASCEKKQDNPKALELDQVSAQVEIGKTITLVANVDGVTWESNKPEIATVAAGVVTGVAEGTAIISAKANGEEATCVVKVVKAGSSAGGDGGDAKVLNCSKFWPIVMDGETLAKNEAKMVASFQPNDVDQFLYVWEETYTGGNGDGINSLGQAGYTSLVVAGKGWAGCGYCLTANGTGWEAAEALRKEIVADPDNYFLHMAIKSTDNFSHCFYFMGNEATKFVLGTSVVYAGPVYKDFNRNGSWAEFDIPMADYVNALATAEVAAGVNVFVALSEGTQGNQLNLDAVYFYKK